MRTDAVLIEAITIGPRHRSVNGAKVLVIAESMRQLGLQQPISVWWCSDNDTYHLVAGLHRLRAAESLGWVDIDCFLVEMNEWDRQLWEIDENLCRAELSPVQVAEHTAARKVAWEARRAATAVEQPALPLEPDEAEPTSDEVEGAEVAAGENGQSLPIFQSAGRGHKGFAADTAAKTGRSKRAVNLAVHRAEKIAPDVRQGIVGTALDTGASLDRLAKLTHEEQRRVVAAGELPPSPSANLSAPVTTALAPPKGNGKVTPPSPGIHELVSDRVARLPVPDDYEQSTQRYLMSTLEEMAGLAAGLYDVLLDVGDGAGASRVAYEFGLPTSAMPMNYGAVFGAIDATKLSKKELSTLAGDRYFANYRQQATNELSMEELHRYRRLLERIGLWPKPAPAAVTPEAPAPSKARPEDDDDVIDLVQILHGNLDNALLKETASIARRIGDRFTIAEVFVAADEGDWEESS